MQHYRRLRIVTYNAWHGLSGRGKFHFGELEDQARRFQRHELQLKLLKTYQPDLLFMQELNPLADRLEQITNQTGLMAAGQLDQAGLKLLGVGFPSNLNTGLGVFARRDLSLFKMAGIKLSGTWGWVHPLMSLQFNEFRYALVCEITHPDWGRILLINLHLHHGLELSAENQVELRQAVTQGMVTERESAQVLKSLRKAETRRECEAARILAKLSPLIRHYDGCILAGDLNSSEKGSAYKAIVDAGFVDLYREAHKNAAETGLTWDPAGNSLNHKLESDFQLPVEDPVRSEVYRLMQNFNSRPRRIDFVFAKGLIGAHLENAQVIGQEAPGGFSGSDHFGVLIDLKMND